MLYHLVRLDFLLRQERSAPVYRRSVNSGKVYRPSLSITRAREGENSEATPCFAVKAEFFEPLACRVITSVHNVYKRFATSSIPSPSVCNFAPQTKGCL